MKTKDLKAKDLTPAQIDCLKAFLRGNLLWRKSEQTKYALQRKGLIPWSNKHPLTPILRAAIEAMRPHLSDEELARAEARYAAKVAQDAKEAQETEALREWLSKHDKSDPETNKVQSLYRLRGMRAECILDAGGADVIGYDMRHEAACKVAFAEDTEPPPKPEKMIAAIQAGHPGALRWARIIFGEQEVVAASSSETENLRRGREKGSTSAG